MKDTVELILNRLDALFRYVLPGIIVLGGAYANHPSWFAWCRLFHTPTVLSLGGLSLVVGALWYALHRFSLHQLLDYFCWRWLNKRCVEYRKALRDSVKAGVPPDRIDEHIAVRSSQLIFLFIGPVRGRSTVEHQVRNSPGDR